MTFYVKTMLILELGKKLLHILFEIIESLQNFIKGAKIVCLNGGNKGT